MQQQDDLFKLSRIKKLETLEHIQEDEAMDVNVSDEEMEEKRGPRTVVMDRDEMDAYMEEELDALYADEQERRMARDAKYQIKQKRSQEEEFTGFGDILDRSDSDSSDSEETDVDQTSDEEAEAAAIRAMQLRAREERKRQREAKKNPLLVDIQDEDDASKSIQQRTQDWFSQEIFAGISDDDEEEEEDEEKVSNVGMRTSMILISSFKPTETNQLKRKLDQVRRQEWV
jgi:hypothetical protein